MGRLRLTTTAISAALMAALLVGCYDSFDDSTLGSTSQEQELIPNSTIGNLHSMLISERLDIMEQIIVEGTVTANDKSGNIYKSFFIENNGYALEVLEGQYDLHATRPVGLRVVLMLEDLSIARYNGVVRVGLKAVDYSYYTLDYLESQALIDQHIFSYESTTTPEARKVSIGELTSDMCGSIIEIEGLIHVPASDDLQPYTWEGYECFEDDQGERIWSNTSSYANFATETIPSQSVAIKGVVKLESSIPSVSGQQYTIIMRDVEDCTTL